MNSNIKNIAVYCGSNFGEDRRYFEAAQQLGTAIADQQHRLVYGGGKAGLMGVVADAALAAGGEVYGVIPTFLREKELAHTGLTMLEETADMATRRQKMIDLADAFIALPGGLGTYEELFEVLSSAQLRLHEKPIGLLNIGGFFNALVEQMRYTAEQGFMPLENMKLLCIAENAQDLLNQMYAYRYTDAKKWQQPAWMKENK